MIHRVKASLGAFATYGPRYVTALGSCEKLQWKLKKILVEIVHIFKADNAVAFI